MTMLFFTLCFGFRCLCDCAISLNCSGSFDGVGRVRCCPFAMKRIFCSYIWTKPSIRSLYNILRMCNVLCAQIIRIPDWKRATAAQIVHCSLDSYSKACNLWQLQTFFLVVSSHNFTFVFLPISYDPISDVACEIENSILKRNLFSLTNSRRFFSVSIYIIINLFCSNNSMRYAEFTYLAYRALYLLRCISGSSCISHGIIVCAFHLRDVCDIGVQESWILAAARERTLYYYFSICFSFFVMYVFRRRHCFNFLAKRFCIQSRMTYL